MAEIKLTPVRIKGLIEGHDPAHINVVSHSFGIELEIAKDGFVVMPLVVSREGLPALRHFIDQTLEHADPMYGNTSAQQMTQAAIDTVTCPACFAAKGTPCVGSRPDDPSVDTHAVRLLARGQQAQVT